ncbi:MAG: OadG family protein [Paludibacteraceae bacterium]|nr:OadG family protein [Paludibacteraceae bacterium]
MLFLEITSFTWMVTGLGFGLVLALLIVFVFIMKLMGWIMQPKSQQTEAAPVQEVSAKPSKVTGDSNDLAAVATALHLYYNALHDEEPTKVTVVQHPTSWNTKVYAMNNLTVRS